MATCAVCVQPLGYGERFLLDDTEVFHVQCFGQRYLSKQRVSDERVRTLEAQLADTRRAAARVEAETHQLRNQVTSKGAENIQLTALLSTTRNAMFANEDRALAAQEELRAARNEIAAMRIELAANRPTQAPAEKQDEDATVQRFRMLELD